MKKRTFIGGLSAALLVALAACSSGPATKTANTAASNANAANRAATPAATPAATNANNANSANTASGANQTAGAQDFTLVNRTGVEIHALYVAPHESDDWEEDVLGRDTLADGATVDIKFDRSEKAAMWDMRVEDKDGNSIEWENLNLLEISKVTLHYKNGKATAEVE